MKRIYFLIMLLCLIFSDVSYGLRCGRELVEIGDHKYDVSEKCGQPNSIERHLERRGGQDSASIGRRFAPNTLRLGRQQYSEIDISVEEWIYDFGHSRFRQYLRFENGELTEIKSLGRGD
jgi:hypothetical protein